MNKMKKELIGSIDRITEQKSVSCPVSQATRPLESVTTR